MPAWRRGNTSESASAQHVSININIVEAHTHTHTHKTVTSCIQKYNRNHAQPNFRHVLADGIADVGRDWRVVGGRSDRSKLLYYILYAYIYGLCMYILILHVSSSIIYI